jgi:hypothetical protein
VDFTAFIVLRITVQGTILLCRQNTSQILPVPIRTSREYFVPPGYVWTSTFDVTETELRAERTCRS